MPEEQSLAITRALVSPINGLPDLINAAAFALEHPDQPMECERVIDAISRLCSEEPHDFVASTAALKKRAAKIAAGSYWSQPRPQILLACFILSWLEGSQQMKLAFDSDKFEPSAKFLFKRLSAIAHRVARKIPLPLLSAPTHEGGWIDPTSLIEKVAHGLPHRVNWKSATRR